MRPISQPGHAVVAVEPTDALRNAAASLHQSPNIEWIEDGMPALDKISMRTGRFDLILLTAVLMHLNIKERRLAMPVIASLLQPSGVLIMTLRHGPIPEGRRMFEISDDEMIGLAKGENLDIICQEHGESILQRNWLNGVTWSHFAFRKSP